jgi:DNA-3-methyladenine glycosylase
MAEILPQSFYARDALEVAPLLLGKLLCRDGVVLRISEVEAYRHPGDSASHCRMGVTPRNAPMWGPAGRVYVYLCYGLHNMLNLVTNREGEGAAVLIRSCEPVAGHDVIRSRRGGIEGPQALAGPGKVGAALALTTACSGLSLCDGSDLHVVDAPAPEHYLVGPRVGIAYATPAHQRLPWRFALADSAWVTQRKTLQPYAAKSARRSRRVSVQSLHAARAPMRSTPS